MAIRFLAAIVGLSHFTATSLAADKVTLSIPVKAVSFAPIFLALDSGGFRARNIDMNVVVLKGGTPVIASLLAGDAQFASLADDELLKVADAQKIIRVHAYSNSFTQNLQVRSAIVQQRHVTDSMSWKDRVKNLKGITVGVLQLGGASDIAGRWLWQQAGLDPKADMKIIRVGGLPALIAAMREENIDAFVLSPPAGQILEAQKTGKIVVKFNEVPEWADEPYLGIDSKRDFLANNKELVGRVVAAVAEAQAKIYADPESAAAVLAKGSFSSTKGGLLAQSLVMMRSAYRPEKMTQQRWKHISDMRVSLGIKDAAQIEMKEGIHWTNEFAK